MKVVEMAVRRDPGSVAMSAISMCPHCGQPENLVTRTRLKLTVLKGWHRRIYFQCSLCNKFSKPMKARKLKKLIRS